MTTPAGRLPSPWITRFADRVPPAGLVLDLACGTGRHGRLFLERGHPITLVDRNLSAVRDLQDRSDVEAIETDLEDGASCPLASRVFAGVVVTNYLYRPLLPALVAAVVPGGVLLYETFAQGNEVFGKPSNPDFLLAPGELLDSVQGQMRVRAYEDLVVDKPRPAAIQRICAERPLNN